MLHRFFLLFSFIVLFFSGWAQSPFYGARYINSMDSLFLQRVAAMEKQKDSEITNVVFYSHHEKRQIVNLQKFLKNPFAAGLDPIDYDAIQSALDKYYQASKIQLLYDLDVTAQPKQVLAFTMQPFHPFADVKPFSVHFTPVAAPTDYFTAQPFRPDPTLAFLASVKDAARTMGELRIFFPETYKMLRAVEPTGQFPDFGGLYKKLIRDDLDHVFWNVFKYIDDYPAGSIPDMETTFIKERNIKAITLDDNYFLFKQELDIMDKATLGMNPITLLEYYDTKLYKKALLTKAKKGSGDKFAIAIHGMNLIANALRDTTNAGAGLHYWISIAQLQQLLPTEKRYFIALLYRSDPEYFDAVCNLGPLPDANKIEEAIDAKVVSAHAQLALLQDLVQAYAANSATCSYTAWLNMYLDLFISNCFAAEDFKLSLVSREDLLRIYECKFSNDHTSNVFYTLKVYSDLLQVKNDFSKEMHSFLNTAGFLIAIANTNNNEQLQELLKKYVPRK